MSVKLQVIVIVCLVLSIAFIISQIAREKLDFKFGIGWIFIALVLGIMTIWQEFLGWLTHLFGIKTPVNFLLLLAIILLVSLIYNMTKTIDLLQEKVKRLSQEVAILRRDTAIKYSHADNGHKEQQFSDRHITEKSDRIK